jgi:phosphonate transport system substrate-binding protein
LFLAGYTLAGYTTACQFSPFKRRTKLPEKLNFTVTDTASLEELRQNYENFRVVLQEVLQTEVAFSPVNNLVEAAPAMIQGQLDMAWAGPSEYVVLRARAQAIPIVALVRPDYRTVLVVRRDRNIQSVADLKDKTIDMYKPGSSSSHIGVIKILLNAGLEPQADVKTVMSGKRTLAEVNQGQIDAIGMASHRYQQVLEEEELSPEDYTVVADLVLPSDVLSVNSLLEPDQIALITSRILENQAQLVEAILSVETLASKFTGTVLKPAKDQDYDLIREVYGAIGQENFL